MSPTRRVRILPDRLINQIAAGEVVERPASVVKELVENALDAGATRVDVSVRNGGKTEIRVADDGHGMGRDDALLALDRHATSKIADLEDLAAIHTLGFRGEALPSIGSVSRLSVETADREGAGTRVLVSGGQISDVQSCARRVGTTVTVRSLFFNVPARAKFLRSAAAEARAVSETVTTIALAHPDVTFTLESNGRVLAELPATPELRGRIAAIWDRELAGTLIPVASAAGAATITGLVQRPHAATPGSRRAYLFVNGRPFTDRYLVRAADRGYQTTIAPGARPSLFLYLDVPDGQVDVNVHPAKAEVRFRDRIGVEAAVEAAVRAALAPLASTPSLGARPGDGAEPDFAPAHRTATGGAPSAFSVPAPLAATTPAEAPQQMSFFVPGAAEPDAPEPIAPGREPGASQPAMWQVHNTYIFAETRGGLIIVDQHSAHERVLYEELMRGYGARDTGSQRLLFPLTLRLSPAEFAVVEELGGILARMGFEIEPFGSRAVIVHAAPNPHPYFDAERCLREMIAELTEGSPLVDTARNQHQRIALSYACKAAIKAGQRLAPREMTELFDRLFATELPYHDIHGRPTVVQLSIAELHNRFRRSG
ncbi:MAG TPA: DNA mismatch repair endonuclease MutL [Longimicrobiaceae bacterium]|nr:DNA mismatch repair endonuclease MutL [Longimicrobiaceae bacterium]